MYRYNRNLYYLLQKCQICIQLKRKALDNFACLEKGEKRFSVSCRYDWPEHLLLLFLQPLCPYIKEIETVQCTSVTIYTLTLPHLLYPI